MPLPPPGHLPSPGLEPGTPALQADALPSEPPAKPRGGICVNRELVHFIVQQELTQYCKAVIVQLKKLKKPFYSHNIIDKIFYISFLFHRI